MPQIQPIPPVDHRDNGQRFRDDEIARLDDARMDAHWESVAEINAFGPYSRVNRPDLYPSPATPAAISNSAREPEKEISGPVCLDCGSPAYRGGLCLRCWRECHD